MMGSSPVKNVAAVTLLLYLFVTPTAVLADGNVGCLFSPDLCAEEYEWCFDDYAFGRCLPLYGHVDEDYLYRRELGPAELQALEGQMTRLFAEGFRWSHAYTQCVMQASLRAVQLGEELEEEPATECEPLAERQPQVAAASPGEDESTVPVVPVIDPQDVAFVRFTPSADNPHPEFADEFYFPPLEHHEGVPHRSASSTAAELRALSRPVLITETNSVTKKAEKGSEPRLFHALYNTPDAFRMGQETRDRELRGGVVTKPEHEPPMQPAYTEGGMVFVNGAQSDEGEESNVVGTEADEEEARLEAILEQYGGGLDFGFKRRERLDVKKPGPPFLTNSYAYRDDSPAAHTHQQTKVKQGHHKEERSHDPSILFKKLTPLNMLKIADSKEHTPTEIKGVEETNELPDNERKPPPPRRRPPPPPQPPPAAEDEDRDMHFDLVDTSYAYVGFKNSVSSWKQGADVVNLLADLLHLDRSDLSHVRVDLNEVTFKVEEPNAQGLNASEVARKVDSVKDKLKEVLKVEVTAAGIGDKMKLPAMVQVGRMETEMRMMVLALLGCGVLAAGILGAAALLLIKRHAKSRDKLQSLSQPDQEASKDYQELCRARMAAKSQHGDKAGADSGPAVGPRVGNLSRESDNNSPSSRSSTSSWSEEPALTNMDISTGHMVLSYMEDHLHNKGRLEQEWVALCAYEAEPCATTIAYKTDNAKKNRYPDVVPYDHSRVVLNALANAAASDYINASSITDHDPRNPAYIATQGPLASTAADFWQMVWEQGSVVMVMLSRLTENGTAMCHRYWPEEGSEVYHVYEVHLVSEHIWCDDYLVRSFYLKNVKTGETRTVTQFHFLSWPEGGVPTSTKALLEFRRKVNKSYRGRSCPIVVHCSDGAGRTGTYCLMDMVLNRMAKGAKEIDIAATLEHIRDQRGGMVRTKAQFELVLMAVAEEVHAILKALPQ